MILKRIFDFVVSLILIILLLPLLFVVSLAVCFVMGSPVFFYQDRPGLNGVTFKMRKFRTMQSTISKGGVLLSDSERITKLGHFLRKYSIDELPELLNVLSGDMSLVGPRPLLKEYLSLYNPEQMRRHNVKPGITGWAQVNGRNSISWCEKFIYDIWYVDNRSFWVDIKILYLTFFKVLSKKNVNYDNDVTMPKFTGSD